MAGRDINPYGFGAFKVYVADQLTNPDIKKLTNYFNFPPALRGKLEGDGLGFVNTLVDRGIIKETDISRLLNALNELQLCGKQDDLKEKFMGCREVVSRVEHVSSPLKPSPTPEEGEPSKKVTNVEQVSSPLKPSPTHEEREPSRTSTNVEQVSSPLKPSATPEEGEPSKKGTSVKQGASTNESPPTPEEKEPSKTRTNMEQVSSPLKPSPTHEEREPSRTSTNVEQTSSPVKPSSNPEKGEPSKEGTYVEHVSSPLKPSPTPEEGEPSKEGTYVEQVSSPLKPSPPTDEGELSKKSTNDDTKPVFISFSFENKTKVQKIVATVDEALWPNSCWICTTGIKGAQILDEEIAIAIGKAKVVVGMISPDFINSVECTQELLLAFEKKKTVLPVHIESVKFPYELKHGGESALQLKLARHLYMELTAKDMENDMQKVILRIKELISQEDNQSTAKETKDSQVIPYSCAYCKIIFKESWQHQYHTETEKHKGNINIQKDDEKWDYGEPPLGITDGKFKLCPEQSGKCSGCSHAESQEELDEWNKRHKYRLEALYNYQPLPSEDMTDQTSKFKKLVKMYEEEKQKDGKHIKNVGNISYLSASDQIIAKGSEGALIFVGKYKDEYVAVKRTQTIQREEELCNKMHDKDMNNVVKIICIEKDAFFYYVVTPLCECDLESFIKAGSSPSQLQQIELCLDILSGLMSLHSMAIVHRDLKPRNVLINKKGDALLTDFGISRICTGTSTNVTSVMGSLRWLASEHITAATEEGDTRLTKASDIQIAGCLVYYILTNGHHPFEASESSDTFQLQANIQKGMFQLLHLENLPENCKSLLTKMLDKEVKNRPRIEDCLQEMKEVKSLLILQLSKEIQPSLPGVEVLCGESSIDMTKDRNSKQTWSFRVKSRKNLQKISFRHNDSRELFFFPSPDDQPRPKELFAKDLTDSEGYTCFEVHFQAKEYTGLFDEQVIFDFGEKHFVDWSCQQLLVWIDPKSPTQKEI